MKVVSKSCINKLLKTKDRDLKKQNRGIEKKFI